MVRAIVRLKDIADKTGFSTNTVSLALRESPRIPAATRARIRAAADELNYLPNHIAKSLVSRETKTIGLMLTDITNPLLTRTAQTIEMALAVRGYGTLIAISNNSIDEETRAIELFRSRQVDGMLIYPTNHRRLDHIRPLRRVNYPIVLLVADPDAGIDAVCVDERMAGYKAARHLIGLGHRSIGMIDGAGALGNGEKREGFVRALTEEGLHADPAKIVDPGGHSIAHGSAAMERMLSSGAAPTAVFASNDSLALGALSWCRRSGLGVPGDVAIVGCDNIEFGAFAAVPLSSVNYAVDSLTELAVSRLMGLIGAAERLPEPEVTMIEPDLVVRESSLPA